MNNLDQQKPGGKSGRRKQKRNKAGQPKSPAPAQAESEPRHAAMAEPVAADEAPLPEATAPAETVVAAKASAVQAEATPAAPPATGVQAIADAYRDYTRKSLDDAQTFAEKLSAARSLDKAMEAQTEFARQACESFADNARKIRKLHRELFWQAFWPPGWPTGRSRQG